jgi:hypothetical protein
MSRPERTWSELAFSSRPDHVRVQALLEHLAASDAFGDVVFEARGSAGRVRYLLGSDQRHHAAILRTVTEHLGVEARQNPQRADVDGALRIRSAGRGLPLRTETVESSNLSLLSSLCAATVDEEVVLQLVLGRRLAPTLDDHPMDDRSTLRALLSGSSESVAAQGRNRLRAKRAVHGFEAALRLGARGGSESRTQGLLRAALGAVRTLEAPGARLSASPTSVTQLSEARTASRLLAPAFAISSVEASAILAWPSGKGFLPGQPPEHPKKVSAPANLRSSRSRHAFAVSSRADRDLLVGIEPDDTLTHTLLLGRTGSGKSVLMSHLILDAVEDGRSVVVIDPKGDLITKELLPRIPAHRRDDVVVIDPMSDLPVGINPFAEKGSPELIADGLLAVFKTVYADSWGPRLEDVLSSALLTLAQSPGSTLAMLPALLTDAGLRHRLTKNLRDPVGLEPFWRSYEAMSPEQRAQVIAPVLNKLRPYLTRSGLRRTLGQAEPKFALSDLFTKRRIVLVNLNKGLLGAEGSRLLGSLVVSQLWPLILGRAAVPAERRHVVNVFIDEVQDYLALPTDLADAFAQARGLGVGFTVAHQYRRQLPAGLLAGLDSNARTQIAFGLDHDDATALARRAPSLSPEDFMSLGQHEIYLSLMRRGHSTGWFSAKALAPSAPVSDPAAVLRASLERYGVPTGDVDAAIEKAIGVTDAGIDPDEPIGRRPKRSIP